jgi:hypothetical protein
MRRPLTQDRGQASPANGVIAFGISRLGTVFDGVKQARIWNRKWTLMNANEELNQPALTPSAQNVMAVAGLDPGTAMTMLEKALVCRC